MARPSLSDKAWRLKGLVASEAGTLTLRNGRLIFVDSNDVFNIPITDLQDVRFPWFYFDTACILTIEGYKYRLSFIQPGNTAGGEYAIIADARRTGRRWKSALAHSKFE
jgi:hypothetical protein